MRPRAVGAAARRRRPGRRLYSSTSSQPLPVVASPVPPKKQPRVIKLTAEQFAALKSGKSGQIVLSSGVGGTKRETITLASPQPRKVARISEESEELVDDKVSLSRCQ